MLRHSFIVGILISNAEYIKFKNMNSLQQKTYDSLHIVASSFFVACLVNA